MNVFNIDNKSPHTQSKAFLDPNGGQPIQRFDTMKYPILDKLTEKELGFFWRPEEIDVMKDSSDFKNLSVHEQHIFTSNLKRQILLDSVQGRSPNLALLPLATLPELEVWIETWAFNETIHSRSYTHIIRNVYPNPTEVFDEILELEPIIACASDISEYYNSLIQYAGWYQMLGEGVHEVNGKRIEVDLYELKKQLWLCIMSINVLEGIRFYVSFACSWAFAELKQMEGNAKIIKLIARDENLHLASTQTLLSILPDDDEDFRKIREELRDEAIAIFDSAAQQEKDWAKYLFQDGSMIGLNEELLCQYVDWIKHKRMAAVGLGDGSSSTANPLPWTQKWIAGADVQVAPQETEITNYVVGGTKQDVDSNTFKGFSL
jgi:ribonucleoside-diphosphate reductase beta chain